MSDAKYFSTTKKGEIHELREDLNSFDKVKVKDAVKKVIANMTVGKDVSSLFADVIKRMTTDDIELKKLVYLYIINYARSQPEKAILVVNAFQKDATTHVNPLVRALAIRTMGCIRVDRITEYLCDPLGIALEDKDPYVRKTAAVCVAKLYDINAELVEERGFIEKLQELISDPNPMVVANAVASLAEVSESAGRDMFGINASVLQKLLTALNECTEWGQVFILDALANYQPTPEEAEMIAERVTPRLQHVNSSVVMSAIKVVVNYLNVIQTPAAVQTLCRKLAPPLVTLLSTQPEIQYVALRNIRLIVQQRPDILAAQIHVFFCKYNDAPYVKMEKLEIMIRLASERNIDQVLVEFKEYAQEVDVEFVRKAVRAIGRCAIKLEPAAERCVAVLLDLIKSKVSYVVQEAIVVIKDIFRRYPNRYERVIVDLCANLDVLDEPDAKAAMIWIVGEYVERIPDAADRLEYFLDTFLDESTAVQLQLLTACVKLFLTRPDDGKPLVTQVLNLATEKTDNPDLRDRGYVYWRLLSSDPAAAKAVVMAEKPVISDDTYSLDAGLVSTLVANLSTLSSVYHLPPESFVKDAHGVKFEGDAHSASDSDASESSEEESDSDDEKDSGEGAVAAAAASSVAPAAAVAPQGDLLDLSDLLGGGASSSAAAAVPVTGAPAQGAVLVLDAARGEGLEIRVTFAREAGVGACATLHMSNASSATVSNAAVRFNKNPLGCAPAGPLALAAPLPPGGRTTARLPVALSDEPTAAKPGYSLNTIQIAIKTDLGVAYFQADFPVEIFLSAEGAMDKRAFLGAWKEIPDDAERNADFAALVSSDLQALVAKLKDANVFWVAKRNVPDKGLVMYFSAHLRGVPLLMEVTFNAPDGVARSAVGCIKSADNALSLLGLLALRAVLCGPQ